MFGDLRKAIHSVVSVNCLLLFAYLCFVFSTPTSSWAQTSFNFQKTQSNVDTSSTIIAATEGGGEDQDGEMDSDVLLSTSSAGLTINNDTGVINTQILSTAMDVIPVGGAESVPTSATSGAVNAFLLAEGPPTTTPDLAVIFPASFFADSSSNYQVVPPTTGNARSFAAIYLVANEGYATMDTAVEIANARASASSNGFGLTADKDGDSGDNWTITGDTPAGDITQESLNYLRIVEVTLGADLTLNSSVSVGVSSRVETGQNAGASATLFTGIAAAVWTFGYDLSQGGDINDDGNVDASDVALVPRDQDGDGDIDTTDAAFFQARFDLNGDGSINNDDVDLLETNALGSVFDDPEMDGVSNLRFDLNGDGVVNFLVSPNGEIISDSDVLVRIGLNSEYALPGDFNGDGRVDAADYTVWRDNFGSSASLNGNGDESGMSVGVVDGADYTHWRSNFGNAVGVPIAAFQRATIPEPSGFRLVAAFVAVLAATQSRLRRHE